MWVTYSSKTAAISAMRTDAIAAHTQAKEWLDKAEKTADGEAFYVGAKYLNEYQNLRTAYLYNCFVHGISPNLDGLDDPYFPIMCPVKSI